MKSQIFVLQAVLMLSGIFVLLSGCTAEAVSTTTQSGTATELATAVTQAEVVPLITRTSMAITSQPVTSTPSATISPTATPTQMLGSVITSTSVLTPTLIPTLSPEQVEGVIHGLFENNGGCLLPCFWGITPGQTDWQTAQRFLTPLALQIYVYADNISAEVHLPAPEEVHLTVLRQTYAFDDGIVTSIKSPVLQTLNFQPSTILDTYGAPDEVWLNTANASREGHWGFIMYLFYPQQGFMLQYNVEAVQQNDHVLGCGFEQDDIILLGTWLQEGKELSFETASRPGSGFAETTFALPLEDATGMNVGTFYETFKDPNNPICLETPLSLWPAP